MRKHYKSVKPPEIVHIAAPVWIASLAGWQERNHMKRALVCLAGMCLLVPMAPAVAETTPTQPAPPQAEEIVPGKMDPADPMSISVLQEEPARASGLGQVKVPLMRRKQGGPVLKNVKAQVNVTKGGRITAATGKGWRCKITKDVANCRRSKVARTPEPIYATFRTKKSWKKRSIGVQARAKWQGGPTKATKREPWMVRNAGRVSVKPPLRVSLKSAVGTQVALATNSRRTHRQFLLLARIRNVGSDQVSAQWKQIGGPKAKMLQPQRVKNVRSQLAQTIQIPESTRKGAKLRFQVRVSGNGQVVTRKVTVRTRVHRQVGKPKSRNKQLTKLAKASNERSGRPQGRTVRLNNGVQLQAKKWRVAPGKSTTVSIKTKRKISSVQWYVEGRPAGRSRSIIVHAPPVPGRSTLFGAFITMPNGRVLQEGGHVTAKSVRSDTPTDASPENIAAVCKIAADTKGKGKTTLELAGGVTLELSDADTAPDKDFYDKNDKCTGKGKIDFSGATLTHPSATFDDVEGTFTAADGMQIGGATWELPRKLQVLPKVKSVGLAAGDAPAGARLAKGEWQLMEGALKLKPIDYKAGTIDGLPLIPLADGWQFAAGQSLVTFLNATPEDEVIKDGTVQLSEAITGPNDLSIELNVATADDQWDYVSVSATNIGLGETVNGDTLMAEGNGRLTLQEKGSSIELGIKCMHKGEPKPVCELIDGFLVQSFKVKISSDSIGVLGEAAIPYGNDEEFDFAVVGAYTSASNWTLAAKGASPWELGDGMSLTDLAGNVGMQPIKGEKDKSQLIAGFTGTMEGLTLADNIRGKISPNVTNACAPDEKECKPGEIRFALDAEVEVTLPGNKKLPLSAGTVMNLKTYEFAIDFGFEDISIGPEQLQINKSRFTLSNMESGSCTPHGKDPQPETAQNVMYVEIAAQATVFDGTVAIGGNFDANGYCLWGRPGPLDLGNGMEAKAGILSYTSYPNGADLKLPGEPAELLGKNQMRINGEFELPQKLDDMFSIPVGGLEYSATFDTNSRGWVFALTYTPTRQVVIYQGAGAKLTLTQIGFSVAYIAGTAKLSLKAAGNLHIDGGGGMEASDTPLGTSLNFGFDKSEISATLQAGVETGEGEIVNAFGQDGLIVRKLAVSAGFKVPGSPTLAFNADTTLPASWGSSIGIKNSAPIKLAFSLGVKEPCLAIAIGEQDVQNRKIAVDIADKGFLTAQYFRLVIAPKGCTIPVGGGDSEKIEPGYGFDFEGAILGAPIKVVIDAELGNGLKMKGQVEIPNLDFYVVKLQGATPGVGVSIDMDIDTTAQIYKVRFDAGIEFGVPDKGIGALVVMIGNLDFAPDDDLKLTLQGRATAKLGVIGVDIDPMNLKLGISKDPKSNFANADARLRTHMLGFALEAGGSLTYDQGQLERLRVYAAQTLDIKIAAIAGTAEFDYCLGTLSDLGQNGSECTLFKNIADALPAYRVGFYGYFKFLWWNRPYTWTVFDQKGTNGSDPPDPIMDPQTVPGAIPSLIPNKANPKTLFDEGSDLAWNVNGQRAFFKTMLASAVDNVKACPEADLGSKWKPTDANPNPDPQNVNPYKSDTPCGLIVDVEILPGDGLAPTERTKVICGPTSCKATTGTFKDEVLAMDGPNGKQTQEARDALIAGLRSPLGVLPAGAFLTQRPSSQGAPNLLSPDGRFVLLPSSNSLGLWNTSPVRGEPSFPWISNDQTGPKATRWRLGNDGRLQGTNNAGDTLWSVGTAASGDTSKNHVFLFVQDGMAIYQNQNTGNPKAVWGVTSMGKCFPEGAKCEGKPGT